MNKVGICAVAQGPFERNTWHERFQGMAMPVLESLLSQTGLDFAEDTGINVIVSCSDDVFDARTISDNGMTDVLGGHMRCEEKVAQDGIQAVYYASSIIMSGYTDVVLVLGHSKESQGLSRNMVTHLAFDPFYTRPVGLDFTAAAGLQARAYGKLSGISEEELAETDPLTATLPPTDSAQEGYVPVHFHSKITELGMFELWCQSANSADRWKLEFSVREDAE